MGGIKKGPYAIAGKIVRSFSPQKGKRCTRKMGEQVCSKRKRIKRAKVVLNLGKKVRRGERTKEGKRKKDLSENCRSRGTPPLTLSVVVKNREEQETALSATT